MFSTLMTFMATLPIILPVWQEKPMPRGFLQIERTGFYSTPEELAYQSKAFKSNDLNKEKQHYYSYNL